MYTTRFYRDNMHASGLESFRVIFKQTDLFISADGNYQKICEEAVIVQRFLLDDYISKTPCFFSTLTPLPDDSNAPPIAQAMLKASKLVGVGPMAGVAGAFNSVVGNVLAPLCREFIIENGGDLFMKTLEQRTVSLYAGENRFKDKIRILVKASPDGIGICTSSGKFGHSLSFGKADAVTILSADPVLSDCTATATANKIKKAADIPKAIEFASSISGIQGIMAVCDDKIGLWGDIELT